MSWSFDRAPAGASVRAVLTWLADVLPLLALMLLTQALPVWGVAAFFALSARGLGVLIAAVVLTNGFLIGLCAAAAGRAPSPDHALPRSRPVALAPAWDVAAHPQGLASAARTRTTDGRAAPFRPLGASPDLTAIGSSPVVPMPRRAPARRPRASTSRSTS